MLFRSHFAEKDTDVKCTSPSIRVGGSCCQDLNFNSVCDSHELKSLNELEAKQKEIELQQLKHKVVLLESDVDYYKQINNEPDRWDDDFTIKIRVFDEDEEEIEDAYVRMIGDDEDYYETDYTDDNGEAKFRNVEEDCYKIKVRADGYESKTKDRCLDESETIRFYLEEEN